MLKISVQKPNYGSTWYRGNFTLGLAVDSHPKFINVILAFWFFEVVISWTVEQR